ncbi:MAG TPA: DUF2007 domain-containing protein [Vicinamibacteria bacterium]|jgi:hypothetical protein|nr:DUF2007 domain-containing protein [Vicinamibacteria bacterium]
MTDDDREALREHFEQESTEALVSILRNHDEQEWRPEVFEVVATILKSRGLAPGEVVALGPEPAVIDVVESEPTVTVANFFSPAEAHGSRMALEEAGIPAWVMDEGLGTIYGVGVGTRVQVRASDADAARQVLSSQPAPGDALPADIAEPACPACGSRNVAPEAWVETESGQRHQGTRRQWHYVCADCREAWPLR